MIKAGCSEPVFAESQQRPVDFYSPFLEVNGEPGILHLVA